MSCARTLDIQDLRYAQGKLAHTAYRGLGQLDLTPQETFLRHARQALRISFWVAGLSQHRVIASHLAVQRKSPLNPPDTGMEEQKGLHNFLGQIGPVIPPAKMSEFMQDD